VAQLNFVVGDMPGNARKIIEAARAAYAGRAPAADAGAVDLRLCGRGPVPAAAFIAPVMMP
jgi:NAD+ synthase (glutamine-hydrolysing)